MQKVLMTLVVALGLPLVATAAPAADGVPLAADTPDKTASGTAFTAPKSWLETQRATVTILTAPENDTSLAIVEIAKAAGAQDAVAQAWKAYRPSVNHPVKLVSKLAAQDGWDERGVVEYETSPNELLGVQAVALRHGDAWTVLLIDGHQGTVEKRDSAIGLVFESLRPGGYRRETFAGKQAHPLDATRIAELTSFIQDAMRQLNIPGVAIALYDRGKVVYEGGFGVRELGRPAPVDANTLFMIASNTKGLSTLLLAKLADEGKLRWDEPVTYVYPTFRLGNADTTKRVEVKNLVCACTGVPRKDFEWIFDSSPATPASDTFVQLAATTPTSGFGEVFQYNNLMASAAGYIGGHLVYPDRELGAAYDAAMQADIFGPLGMTSTTLDYSKAMASSDHATPHGIDLDGNVKIANDGLDKQIAPFRPAGAAWSSVHDMIKYVEEELTPGRLPDGTQYISAVNALQRRQPSVPLGQDAYYGMGLIVDKTWGVPVIHHGGDLTGFHSDWFAFPDAGVGAVILTNGDSGGEIRDPFMRRILEVLYDGKPEAAASITAAAANLKAEIAKERLRLVIPADPVLSARLAKHYVNADLGHIDVLHDGPTLYFDFGSWKSTIVSRVNDDKSVSFITADPGLVGFEFVVGTSNGHRTLTTRDGQHEYVYTEAPQ